jgi:hypothetical protein
MKGSSYYRNCKTCGRRIQLRRMPGGQWVAFEGFETLHDCSRKPEYTSQGSAPARTGDDPLSGLDFESIHIPGGFSAPSALGDRREIKKPIRPKQVRKRAAPQNRVRGRQTHRPKFLSGTDGTTRLSAITGSRQDLSSVGSATTSITASKPRTAIPGSRYVASRTHQASAAERSLLSKALGLNRSYDLFKGLLYFVGALLLIYGACFSR